MYVRHKMTQQVHTEQEIGVVPSKQAVAAPLGFADDALEPGLSARTIRIHYDLYKNYATNFNAALASVQKANNTPEMQQALRSVAFQGSGFGLHDLYFATLTPEDTRPGAVTLAHIGKQFGDMATFRERFMLASTAVEGPGWTVLGWVGGLGQLVLTDPSKHQDNSLESLIPVLALDMWEHAYWLDYPNEKAEYSRVWWDLIDWRAVEKRLMMAVNGKTE